MNWSPAENWHSLILWSIGCMQKFLSPAFRCRHLKLWVAWQVNPIAFCKGNIWQSDSTQKDSFFKLLHSFWIDLKLVMIWCFWGWLQLFIRHWHWSSSNCIGYWIKLKWRTVHLFSLSFLKVKKYRDFFEFF